MKTHLYHNSQMEQELHSNIDAAANERRQAGQFQAGMSLL